ncbi:MAG: type II secretion system protein GspG [Acidobacteria bacterium]|nr:type II secretion system protein GspG [Acidobacteriota bacterium]
MNSFLKSRRLVLIIVISLAAMTGVWAITSAADTLSVKQARELLQHLAGANLSKDQVQIKKIESGFGGNVIVEAQIETSFRVKKEKSGWQIEEVRLGDRQWESFELVEEAIKREKARRTMALLQKLADGLAAYQKANGQYAVTEEISELLDFLSPRYMSVAPRFDLWGKEFEYRGTASNYSLFSAGPDGKKGTSDDLVVENGVIKVSSE